MSRERERRDGGRGDERGVSLVSMKSIEAPGKSAVSLRDGSLHHRTPRARHAPPPSFTPQLSTPPNDAMETAEMLASEQLATTQSQRAQTQTQPAPTTPTTPALAPREAVQEEEAEEQVRSPSWPFPRTRRVVFGPPTRAARRERDADAVARPFISRAAPSDLPSSPLAQLCFLTLPAPNASLRRRSSSSRSRSFASTTSSRRESPPPTSRHASRRAWSLSARRASAHRRR